MAGSGTAHLRAPDESLLRVENLVVEFPTRGGGRVHAVTDVSLDIKRGETLGLVGESGCGKSTTGRAVMQLPRPTSGHVWFDRTDLTTLRGSSLRRARPQLQMIFQDPISSLNPRRKVKDIVSEGLNIWKVGDKNTRSEKPVSALDVSVQAQILNLLEHLKARYGLTMIFIAHDLAVVKNVSDIVAVMYLGKLCEIGSPDELFRYPTHPYTAALLSAIPVPDPEAKPEELPGVGGEVPSPLNPPSGCRFRTCCPRAADRCAQEEPKIREIRPSHYVACHFPLEVEPVAMATPTSDGSGT